MLGRLGNCSDYGENPGSQVVDWEGESKVYEEAGIRGVMNNKDYLGSIAN